MSRENEYHINKSDAVFATVSGALIGAGIVAPPLIGLGITVGAVGALRVKSHERDHQLSQASNYLSDPGDDTRDKNSGC